MLDGVVAMNDLDRIRRIGFNTSVDVGERNLHVQTEVLVRDQVVIRTLVLEGGAIRKAERLPCPEHLQTPEELEEYVRVRHEEQVAALKSNEV